MQMEITRGVVGGAQKVVIYGPEGIGKSTFAAQFPDPLFIDTEGSTKMLDVARTPRPTSWTMLQEQVRYVKERPGLCRTLVIDTADWAEQLCVQYLVAKSPRADEQGIRGLEGFGFGKGYTYLAEEFGRLLNLLSDVIDTGTNVLVTAHAMMRKFEQPDETGAYDRWELKLQKKTAPLLKEWADMVLFATYETLVVNVDGQGAQKGRNKAKGGRRVMYTSHHPCWDAKNRHGLPEKLPFAYEEIAACLPVSLRVDSGTKTDMEQHKPDPPQENKQGTPDTPYNDWGLPPIPVGKEYLQPLWELMKASMIHPEDLQTAVSKKGYYLKSTPIENYDPDFITGVLVGAWPQVQELIEKIQNEDIPF